MAPSLRFLTSSLMPRKRESSSEEEDAGDADEYADEYNELDGVEDITGVGEEAEMKATSI